MQYFLFILSKLVISFLTQFNFINEFGKLFNDVNLLLLHFKYLSLSDKLFKLTIIL